MDRFDLVVLADPRPRFAEGRCLAALLAAAARGGYRTALLPVLSPLPTPSRPFHPAVSRLLARGEVALLDGERPHEAGLLLVHHLLAVRRPRPAGPTALRPDGVLLRVDQPWRAADGTALVPLAEAVRNATDLCGVAPALACADPLLRVALAAGGAGDAELWPPVSDLARREARPTPGDRRPIVVGRHVAGGEGAWPSVADLAAAHAGCDISLAEEAALRAPPAVPGCRLLPGELADPAAYLHGLDAYVLATSDAWRAAFPPGLAEALAAGVPLVAPPALEPILGPAASYARAAEVPARLRELATAPGDAALAFHEAETSPAALLRRLGHHLGPPRPSAPRLRLRRDLRARRRALFLSPNGIGMGHLTRLLAVARRCAADLEPVFLSMSQGVGVVGSFGYLGEYLPSHAHTGESAEAWRTALAARLSEAVAFHDPRCVVFDGNVPYQGLVDCRLAHPDRPFVWIRRALWRRDAGRATIDRARHFDLVIEPGELAAELDPGVTAGRRGEAVGIAPVILLDPSELPDRDAARRALGLDPDRIAVLVQLGSRNNFDYAAIDRVILDELGPRADVELVFVDWLIGEAAGPPLPPHVRRLSTFPVARHLRAFDLAISAAGYNSFHELLAAGVPTIFVPNENPAMDAQELRALWAERRGLALLARQRDPYRMAWAAKALLDPAHREAVRARCAAAVPPCDGATDAARLVLELSAATRLPRRADQRLPHALTRPAS